MNDQTFEILRTAVNLAKQEQIRSVSALKQRLNSLYDNCSDDVDAAIKFWAAYEHQKS